MKSHIYLVLVFLILCGCQSKDGDSVRAKPSEQTFKWKMVTTWPANFPVFQEGAEKFARDVATISNGRLEIKVYGAGELVPALQVFDAVSQGVVEMGHGASYYWAGKVPAAQFFSSVPFGLTAKGMYAWLYHGGGLELWRKVYQPFNVFPFPMGNTGVQMGGWFNKKIDSLSDIQGLRMRIPGLGGKIFKQAGGNPVLMAGGDIYTALERGTIDATEWVAPFHDVRLGLDRAVKYYYYPGWHEPGTAFELMINTSRWESLPQDLQTTVTVAAAAVNEWIYTQIEYQNQQALVQLRENKNVEILPFPKDMLKELKSLSTLTLQEEASKDPQFKEVYDAYKQFSKNYGLWSQLADDTYIQFQLENKSEK